METEKCGLSFFISDNYFPSKPPQPIYWFEYLNQTLLWFILNMNIFSLFLYTLLGVYGALCLYVNEEHTCLCMDICLCVFMCIYV